MSKQQKFGTLLDDFTAFLNASSTKSAEVQKATEESVAHGKTTDPEVKELVGDVPAEKTDLVTERGVESGTALPDQPNPTKTEEHEKKETAPTAKVAATDFESLGNRLMEGLSKLGELLNKPAEEIKEESKTATGETKEVSLDTKSAPPGVISNAAEGLIQGVEKSDKNEETKDTNEAEKVVDEVKLTNSVKNAAQEIDLDKVVEKLAQLATDETVGYGLAKILLENTARKIAENEKAASLKKLVEEVTSKTAELKKAGASEEQIEAFWREAGKADGRKVAQDPAMMAAAAGAGAGAGAGDPSAGAAPAPAQDDSAVVQQVLQELIQEGKITPEDAQGIMSQMAGGAVSGAAPEAAAPSPMEMPPEKMAELEQIIETKAAELKQAGYNEKQIEEYFEKAGQYDRELIEAQLLSEEISNRVMAKKAEMMPPGMAPAAADPAAAGAPPVDPAAMAQAPAGPEGAAPAPAAPAGGAGAGPIDPQQVFQVLDTMIASGEISEDQAVHVLHALGMVPEGAGVDPAAGAGPAPGAADPSAGAPPVDPAAMAQAPAGPEGAAPAAAPAPAGGGAPEAPKSEGGEHKSEGGEKKEESKSEEKKDDSKKEDKPEEKKEAALATTRAAIEGLVTAGILTKEAASKTLAELGI